MNFFKNKRVIAAIVAVPILAILVYLSTDSVVKEKPGEVVEGKSYPLVAKPNCRHKSGECDLHNLTFDAKLTVDLEKNRIHLMASHPLENAMMGFVGPSGAEVAPIRMMPDASDNQRWSMEMSVEASEDSIVRVVLQADNTRYFADTTMQFATYQTAFDKDFRTSQ